MIAVLSRFGKACNTIFSNIYFSIDKPFYLASAILNQPFLVPGEEFSEAILSQRTWLTAIFYIL
jgi:hypothetical protein